MSTGKLFVQLVCYKFILIVNFIYFICNFVVRNSDLLKLSRIIFTNLISNEVGTENDIEKLHLLIWCLRCALIHQITLGSVTSSLHEEITTYIKQIMSLLENDVGKCVFNKQIKLNVLTEIINALIWFGDVEQSKKYFKLAQELSDIKINLTGCLGTRTRFQQNPLPQLMVTAERLNESNVPKTEKCDLDAKNCLPKDEPLEDDTLLSAVNFTSNQNEKCEDVQLYELEQCFMLTVIKYSYRFGSSSDILLREELLAYIYYLLKHSNVWLVHFVLLELRSLYERNNRRRVERSMKQIETLSNCVRNFRGHLLIECKYRLQYFYSTLPSPFWIVEKHLGDLLVSLGVYKSALDYYLRLESWNDVILCYRQLGRKDKAEEVVRKKLEDGGDDQPDMHCLLGELTGELDHYHYSWKISDCKYARAPKMLGMHYFSIKDYDKALEYFKQSVNVNSIQTDIWYRIGYIGLEKEDWKMAADAYRHVLQFDTESFEAWNNLSKAYIHSGEHLRAWHTLQEAIKCNFDEWKIWENYLLVCASVGAFGEMIESWNRLIELKEKYSDDKLARTLVDAVVHDVVDIDKQPSSRLLPKVVQLFGRITSTTKVSFNIWRLYAILLLANNETEITKITRCLQKSSKELLIDGWNRDVNTILQVLNGAAILTNDYIECSEKLPEHRNQLLTSLRLWLNSVVVATRKAKTDFGDFLANNQIILEKFNLLADSIEDQYKTVINLIPK